MSCTHNKKILVVDDSNEKAAVIKEAFRSLSEVSVINYSAIAKTMAGLNMGSVLKNKKPLKPLKKCLQCSNEHRHNNSWCSPECCKAWRESRRGIR